MRRLHKTPKFTANALELKLLTLTAAKTAVSFSPKANNVIKDGIKTRAFFFHLRDLFLSGQTCNYDSFSGRTRLDEPV